MCSTYICLGSDRRAGEQLQPSQPSQPFRSFLWGANLRISELPQAVFEQRLDADAIAVLAVLLDLEKSKWAVEKQQRKRLWGSLPPDWFYTAFCKVKRTTKKRRGQREKREGLLEQRTGFSHNIVKSGLRKLREAGWIQPVQNRVGGKFNGTTYKFTRPGNLLHGSIGPVELKRTATKGLFQVNLLKYFTFPKCVIREIEEPWSLATMESAEKRLYLALCYLANSARTTEYDTTLRKLRKLTGHDIRTIFHRINGLRKRGLVWVDGLDGVSLENLKEHRDTSLHSQMCNPMTGIPLHPPCDEPEADDANYRALIGRKDKRASRQAYLNVLPEKVERLIRELAQRPVRVQGNGDLQICCPFHPDSNPSLSVSLVKRGCWKCWGCHEKGNFSKLIMGLTGCTRVESMQRIGKAAGQNIHFQRPDSEAIAIYRYRDKHDTKTLKEVVRYPNRGDGSKDIRQRQPVPGGGYRWDIQGRGPMLYNVHRLTMGGVAVVCEGEKDCDSITNLGLWGQGATRGNGPVIGVTSGSANSWDASLAGHLRLMNVVIMPDDDGAGRDYAEVVKASLKADGIEYREVSFAGTGCKDASDFLESHTVNEFARLIGTDWVRGDVALLA